MSFYLYLDKTDSLNYFPRNNGRDFTVKLPERLNLMAGSWSCGLVQVCMAGSQSDLIREIFICCDIIEDSFTAAGKLPVLRSFSPQHISGNAGQESQGNFTKHIEYSNIFYIHLRQACFEKVNIYIKDRKWGDSTGDLEVRNCVLHFTRQQ